MCMQVTVNQQKQHIKEICPKIVGLFSLFNGTSTLVGYLMPKPSFEKNNSGTI